MFLDHQISIRMISEGSCDTKESSNDAENSALHHRNKLHFKIYSNCHGTRGSRNEETRILTNEVFNERQTEERQEHR